MKIISAKLPTEETTETDYRVTATSEGMVIEVTGAEVDLRISMDEDETSALWEGLTDWMVAMDMAVAMSQNVPMHSARLH